jgi:hypothetical protein
VLGVLVSIQGHELHDVTLLLRLVGLLHQAVELLPALPRRRLCRCCCRRALWVLASLRLVVTLPAEVQALQAVGAGSQQRRVCVVALVAVVQQAEQLRAAAARLCIRAVLLSCSTVKHACQ